MAEFVHIPVLKNETIDISLPSEKIKRGSRHPFNRIIESSGIGRLQSDGSIQMGLF